MAKATKKAAPKAASKKSAKKTSAKPHVAEPRRVVAEIIDDANEDQSSTPEADAAAEEIDVYVEAANDPHIAELSDETSVQVPAQLESKALTTSDPLQSYLAEIRKYPLLTREQEQEIARKYFETKDAKYAQVLVTANLRFVMKVALEYSRFGARVIDLVQEGNMGLMHAVREFNPYRGVRLITYAVWWIRGYIQEYLMKQYSLVKIGTTRNQKKLFYQLQKEQRALDLIGEPENLKLISTKLNIPEEEVKMMAQRMSGRDVSLDQKVNDDSSANLLDLQKGQADSPENEFSRNEEVQNLHHSIEAIRPSLSAREKIILEERILNEEPLTLQEIGDKYGITREAVRQMEVRLIKKIKDHFILKS